MAEDVTVSFGADDSTLSQAIAKIKASMAQLDAQAVALGKTISQAFAKMGITQAAGFKLAGPEEQNALAQYWASMEKGEVATKKLTASTKELGQVGRQTGIDFGSMAERMAFRLVIFEAVRLAIQGIKYAFDLISNLQQARIQFDAMSDAADHLSGRFQFLKEQASTAIIPIEKAVQVRNTLQDYGASADQAAIYVKDLGQWSQILGVDADKLAESLGRVAQGEGSLQDMRLVTRMMGEQSEAGRQLVQSLVYQENALKRIESQNAVVARSMEAVTRATEQMDERVIRARTRGGEFLKETGLLPAIQAQLPKLAMHPELSPEYLQATGQLRLPQMAPGTSPQVMNQIRDYIAQYREGLKEIQKEEGLTDQAMRANVQNRVFSTDYIMRKAKDAHDDRMRDFREENEAETRRRQGQVTTAQAGITGTRAALAVALPQAVTAPPLALWEGFANSLKGQGLQTKQDFDNGIQRVVDALVNVQTSADGTTAAVGGLENLFRGG